MVNTRTKADEIAQSNNRERNQNACSSENFLQLKTPKIELPEFNDAIENCDIFISLVSLNKLLEDIEKFHFLRKSMKFGVFKYCKQFPICYSELSSFLESSKATK